MRERGNLIHDMRSSLNGVICMGSLLEESDLTDEQADILKYMLLSAEKTLTLIEDYHNSMKGQKQEPPRGDILNPDSCIEIERQGETVSFCDDNFSILIAEDDDISRLYLTTLLKRQNWHIDEAADGQEALDLFKQNTYKLVIMDVSMPGIDGIQAARIIRSQNADIPILAITAHGEGELQEDIREAGMSDILRKPIHDESLLVKIKSLCSA